MASTEPVKQRNTSKRSTKSKKASSTKTNSSKASSKLKSAASKAKSANAKTQGKKAAGAVSDKNKSKKMAVSTAIDHVAKKEAAKKFEKQKSESIQMKMRKPRGSNPILKEDYSPQNLDRNTLIVQYAPLIKYIAQRIAARLPANIELDDLMSSGVIGLMDAIDKYDSSRDNKFKTYAEFRIRGAILDELRSQDWVPRSIREKAKMLERCYQRLEQKYGRQGTDEEVCADLNISQEEYHDLLNQVRSVSLLSFDDVSNFTKADRKSLHSVSESSGGKANNPFNEVNVASVKQMVSHAIEELPEKQRLVLSLYYYEDLNLKEIGRVLDVTESRVSQLHTQAVLRLKSKLRNHWDEFISLMS